MIEYFKKIMQMPIRKAKKYDNKFAGYREVNGLDLSYSSAAIIIIPGATSRADTRSVGNS